MPKRQRMTMFSRNEIERALYQFGYEYQKKRGKGDHDTFIHKDLPWFNVELREAREISENVYKQVVSQLALLCIVTDNSLDDLQNLNLNKLMASVQVCIRNESYKTFLHSELRHMKDENGKPFDNDSQYKKFIDKLKLEYQKKKGTNNNKKSRKGGLVNEK
ncbi:MAG: hypothetical protein J6J23_07105 [Clostridia bacterium]|nr:hypothetical protein [Clostridia bacterium]